MRFQSKTNLRFHCCRSGLQMQLKPLSRTTKKKERTRPTDTLGALGSLFFFLVVARVITPLAPPAKSKDVPFVSNYQLCLEERLDLGALLEIEQRSKMEHMKQI